MKKILLLFCLAGLHLLTQACTSFLLHHGEQLVFGKNYDWITGNGLVCINQRGAFKTSMTVSDGKTISWQSAYGSITFNQYGKEFPTGGMNEKGLVVELMWLDGTRYPQADDRPALGVLQWIQYQLDRSATIDDVIASDNDVRITSQGTPLHYLVADANGKAATIEFLNGRMVVHRGDALPWPVLTNSSYQYSVDAARSSSTYNDNSLERFSKACGMLQKYAASSPDTKPVDYAFSMLQSVAQGTHTKWSIVYDIQKKEVHFKTLGFESIKKVSLSSFSLECDATGVAWEMNQAGSGDVSGLFTPFTLSRNQQLVERSARESASQVRFSEESIRRNWEYAGTVGCLKSH